MIKISLVIISLLILYKGVIDTGDPNSFYSSSFVFYLMLLLDYFQNSKTLNHLFLTIARFFLICLAGFSFMGVLGFLTISEVKGTPFVAFQSGVDFMEDGIISIHALFLTMAGICVLIMFIENVIAFAEKNAGEIILSSSGGSEKVAAESTKKEA